MGGVPPLSEEHLRLVVKTLDEAGGNKAEAARRLDIHVNTFKFQYRTAIKRGFDEAIVHAAPQGHRVKGVSTLYGANGEIAAQWIKTKADEPSLEETIESIRGAFLGLETSHVPLKMPDFANDDMLTLYCVNDAHLGLYAWAPEAGDNWDLGLAVGKYQETMVQVAAGAPSSAIAVVLIGGDFIHADTNEFRTQSGNVLDGDGRTDKVIDAGIGLAVFQIDLALRKNRHVIVRCLKGNHDQYASIAIVHALAAWYRNEPRVTCDTDPSLFWFYRFGLVMLGSTHGHTVKITEFPLIMANRRAEDWGQTKHRYAHLFHVHHKTQHVFEGGGVIAESHQAPVAQDAYHYGKGYLSGRSMQAITYHRERGEIARNNVVIA